MSRKIVIALIATALAVGGCASITRGVDSKVQIITEPPNANVRTSTNYQCLTPCTLTISRKQEFTVSIDKKGYHPVEIPVVARVGAEGGAALAGNVLVGGVIGLAADAASGASLDHCPNPIKVTLTPVDKPFQPPPDPDCDHSVDQAELNRRTVDREQ